MLLNAGSHEFRYLSFDGPTGLFTAVLSGVIKKPAFAVSLRNYIKERSLVNTHEKCVVGFLRTTAKR